MRRFSRFIFGTILILTPRRMWQWR